MMMQTSVTFLSVGLLLGACSGAEDPLLDEGDVGWAEQGLPKPRGSNGARDYCNDSAAPCSLGEGDCDADSQCLDGGVCAANVGPQFLFPVGWDVCAPAHCVDGRLDGDETAVDCGGACSAAGFDCDSRCAVLPPGDAAYCSPRCPCVSGQGDCDSASDCQPGLACGRDNGPSFGLPRTHDVCVPEHCSNRVLDADETFPDCGGSCSAPGFDCTGLCDRLPLAHSNHCSQYCRCGSGAGDCDSDAQCEPGLVCGSNNGPKFGLPADYDVCVPAHCRNRVRDPGETSTDCGGDCASSEFECPASSCPTEATYAVALAGTVTELWPLSYEELLGCSVRRWSTTQSVRVVLANGAVEIVHDTFASEQSYPVVQETDTSLVARRGELWTSDVTCGYTDWAEDTGGVVTVRIDCLADTATVEAWCWGDSGADGCYPNDEENFRGSGPRVGE